MGPKDKVTTGTPADDRPDDGSEALERDDELDPTGTPDDERDDGSEPTGEPDGEGDGDGDAPEPRAGDDPRDTELQRLRRVNEQLLAAQENRRSDREELRVLRQMVLDMRERRDPADADRIRQLQEILNEVASDDSPTARFAMELAREVNGLTRKIHELESADRSPVRIPAKYKRHVERLMATGDYRTPRAAFKAALGEERMRLSRLKARVEDQPTDRRFVRKETEQRRQPAATGVRPAGVGTVRKLEDIRRVKAADYPALIKRYGKDIIERVRKREIEIVPN